MISYLPFRLLLVRKGMTREDLIREGLFSHATSAKLGKDRYVSLEVVDRICGRFGVQIREIVEWKPGNEKH